MNPPILDRTMKYLAIALAVSLLSLHAEEKPRIVSLGGSVTEILYALGAQDQIVGVDLTSQYPVEAAKLPQVGYVRALSPEGILSLRPNLIIGTGEAGPPQTITHLKESGVEVLILPEDHSLEGVAAKIRAIAERLKLKEAGESLVQKIETAKADLAKTVGTHPRAVFLMARDANGLMAAGQKTAADAMLSLAGAKNVAGDYSGYKPLSAEFIAAAAPDVIIVGQRTLDAVGGEENLLKNPALTITPAGKNKRIIAMDDMYLLGFGPRAGDAAIELAAAIRP